MVAQSIDPVRPVLLFDLDGTLTETDELHFEAFRATLEPYGITIDQAYYTAHILGNNNTHIFNALLPNHSIAEHRVFADKKESQFRSMAGTSLTPTPGLGKLLAWANKHKIPTAVVTNAPRANAEMLLSGLGLSAEFEHVVIGEELEHAKPHPLPYLTGLSLLGGTATASCAFEDSLSGVQAARAAGLTVFGIESNLGAEALLAGGAHYSLVDFEDPQLWAWLEENVCRGP